MLVSDHVRDSLRSSCPRSLTVTHTSYTLVNTHHTQFSRVCLGGSRGWWWAAREVIRQRVSGCACAAREGPQRRGRGLWLLALRAYELSVRWMVPPPSVRGRYTSSRPALCPPFLPPFRPSAPPSLCSLGLVASLPPLKLTLSRLDTESRASARTPSPTENSRK